MSRILVIDYSRTGNTHKVAEAIAGLCEANLERICDTTPRRGLWGWIRSGREAMRALPADIRSPKHDPGAYDLVVLGSPVWAGHVSSPMRAYLGQHSGKLAKVALFVTEGGSGGPKALAEMAALAGQQPVATLELRAREIGDELGAKLGAFVGRIHRATASLPAAKHAR